MENDRKKLEELTEENFVEKAEDAILRSRKRKDRKGNPIKLTTTQIRNILAMNADIYNEVMLETGEKLNNHIVERINYLIVRLVYQAGREAAVKVLDEEAKIIKHIKEIQGSRKKYLLFCKYLEALVAYHRFYGGKEQ